MFVLLHSLAMFVVTKISAAAGECVGHIASGS